MKLTNEIIREIVENLDIGFRCFVNRESGELISIPNENNYSNFEPEMWQNELITIKKSRKKLTEIEGMSTTDSLRVMEQFIASVQEKKLKERLLQAIHRHKPFAHFKLEIDNSGTERDRWFEFKKQRLIEWVRNQIDLS